MRCDIHPPLFPYVITRRFAAVYIQEPLSGSLSEPQLRAIAARRSQESGYETSLVFGPDRAVFFGPDGSFCESTTLPFGGLLIIKSPLGDLELVDLSADEGDLSSGCKVDDDPARIMARDLVAWLRDHRGLECSMVATTRDPESRGILLTINSPDLVRALMLEVELKDVLPEEYEVLIWCDSERGH